MNKLNRDQQRVILALGNPKEFFKGHHSIEAIRGAPYEKIMEKSELTLEKTLLSLGWLEARGFVAHDMAVARKSLDYLGQTNIEVAGQSIVRMFYLTEEGLNAYRELSKGEEK